MTRKDFNLIAKTIRYADLPGNSRECLAKDFADVLAATNGSFDKARFVRACHDGEE